MPYLMPTFSLAVTYHKHYTPFSDDLPVIAARLKHEREEMWEER
jgi:hypothetical protein